MAFNYRISFVTDLAANFECESYAINLESYQTSFPSFCAQPSEVAVLFDWPGNLSRCPFVGQVVDLNLLLHRIDSEHADFRQIQG